MRAEKRRPIKILIIDDSAADRRIYRRFLETNNPLVLEILEAGSSHAGLAAFQEHDPSCVILDFKLPDSDGIKTLGEIRKLSEVPVIFVSGQPMPLTQTQAYRQGATQYISKDFVSSASLKAAVAEALGMNSDGSKKE